MVVVPRLFEVLRTRIMKQVSKQGRAANYLMDRALDIGERRAGRTQTVASTGRWITSSDKALRPKIAAKFGGRIKAMVSGGAPLNPEVGIFFDAMGLTMLQGYGQTEAGPVISCNRPARRHRDGQRRPADARGGSRASPKMARCCAAANW